MKILVTILASLFLLATAGLGAIGTLRSMKDARDIDSVYQESKAVIVQAAAAGDPGARTLKDLGEKTGNLRAGAVAFAVAALLALALIVLTFVNRGVGLAALGLCAVVLASIVLSPQYNLGPTAPASARSLAYVLGVLGAVGALAAFGSSALRRRRVAA